MSRIHVIGAIHLSRADWNRLDRDFSVLREKLWVKDLVHLWAMHAKLKGQTPQREGSELCLEVMAQFRQVQESATNRFRVTTVSDALALLTTADEVGDQQAQLRAPTAKGHPSHHLSRRFNPFPTLDYKLEVVSKPEGRERAAGIKFKSLGHSITLGMAGPQEGVDFMFQHPLVVLVLDFLSQVEWSPGQGGVIFSQLAHDSDNKTALYCFGPLGQEKI